MFYYTLNKTKKSHVCASSLTASKTKRANSTWLPLEIMHCSHTRHDYPWPWVSLAWLLYNLQLWRHRRWFRKVTVCFQPIRKEIESSMYSKSINCAFNKAKVNKSRQNVTSSTTINTNILASHFNLRLSACENKVR